MGGGDGGPVVAVVLCCVVTGGTKSLAVVGLAVVGLVVVGLGSVGLGPFPARMVISEHPQNSSCGPYPSPQVPSSHPQLFPKKPNKDMMLHLFRLQQPQYIELIKVAHGIWVVSLQQRCTLWNQKQ